MKLKHLESCLSSITREFPDPKINLEQYPTSAALAASIIMFARDAGDVGPGKTALDLGCGTGMLVLACALMDCDAVMGIDCDIDALSVAQTNADALEEHVDFILCKLNDQGHIMNHKNNHKANSCTEPTTKTRQKNTSSGGRGRGRGRGGRNRGGRHRGGRGSTQNAASSSSLDPDAPDGLPLSDNCVDTVVTNPPFGTKHNAGMDVRFLKAATRLARRAVYSFHKTSTRDYLMKKITTEWGYTTAKVVAELKFDIPATYKFHNHTSMDIDVDLIRIDIESHVDHTTTIIHNDSNELIPPNDPREGDDDDDDGEV